MTPVNTCVAVFLVLGYVIIVVSILNGKTCDEKPSMRGLVSTSTVSVDENKYQQLQVQLLTVKNDLSKAQLANADLSTKLEKAIKVAPNTVTLPNAMVAEPAYRPGVIILGMHRSGTSALGGLVNRMGMKTGGPLIQPAKDNEKGFFERIDVVLQNDYIMERQGIAYNVNTYKYDARRGLKEVLNNMDNAFFNEGRRGLEFLNDPSNYPWMLKDPRLCITLRTWLPLLNFVPAVLFMFRHPMDVALSLHHREGFPIARGLKMWYVYNKRAIQQSNDLCRVVGSHRKLMLEPVSELHRMYSEMRQKCNVPIPHEVSTEDITSFIDVKLQHGRTQTMDKTCEMTSDEILQKAVPLADVWPTTDPSQINLYRQSMRVYCQMETMTLFQSSVVNTFTWDETINDS